MFNFTRIRATKNKSRSKRHALQEILRVIAASEGTSSVENARFSKEDPVNWTDEKVNDVYRKLKLMKF